MPTPIGQVYVTPSVGGFQTTIGWSDTIDARLPGAPGAAGNEGFSVIAVPDGPDGIRLSISGVPSNELFTFGDALPATFTFPVPDDRYGTFTINVTGEGGPADAAGLIAAINNVPGSPIASTPNSHFGFVGGLDDGWSTGTDEIPAIPGSATITMTSPDGVTSTLTLPGTPPFTGPLVIDGVRINIPGGFVWPDPATTVACVRAALGFEGNLVTVEVEATERDFIIQVGANQGQLIAIELPNLQEILHRNGIVYVALDGTATGTGTGTGTTTEVLFNVYRHIDLETWEPGDLLELGEPLSAVEISDMLRRIDSTIADISMARATLGAQENRLDFKIANLDNMAENLQQAESRIRDGDMAALMTEFTQNNIMFQAATAMLAQANALPQGVLQLLG
ncbi:MAG: hypothetical protein FWB97_08915 [Oscillospiraceae bacterium]|nr:hypothetical protein [Oscillospiraceae bacterium]